MTSQVTLVLTCMLFSKALSLTCYQCLPSTSGTCTNEQVTCPDQCLTATTTVYAGGTKITDTSVKTCGGPELCTNWTLNAGIVKLSQNIKCCSTPLCNPDTLPALPQQPLNGRMCYTCDTNICSAKVNCEGDEELCISATVTQASSTVTVKGCVSKALCAASGLRNTPGVGVSSIQCCEGNLCNGAESFTQSFLLMIVPLLSSILFY